MLFDTISDMGLWLGIGAAAFAATAVSLLLVLVVRGRQDDARRLEAALRESSDRLEETLASITSALELARVDIEQLHRLGEIGGSIDLDDVLERTLKAASSLELVDAAMIVIPDDGQPVVATIGLSDQEARAHSPSAPLDGPLHAVDVDDHDAGERRFSGGQIRGGHTLALREGTGEAIGALAVYWRDVDRELDGEHRSELEQLAATAARALENASRFREARQLADLDSLTGLHNYRFFHETLAREVARAHRYGRRLALILLDVDDLKAVNSRAGHLAGDAVLAVAAARVQGAVRGTDIAGRVGGDELAVILPESGLRDAENLYARLQGSVASQQESDAAIRLSAGIAELRRSEGEAALFERADAALYEAKRMGKGRSISSRPAHDSAPGSASRGDGRRAGGSRS